MWAAHDGMGWWMLFGGIFWIFFIVLLVYLWVGAVDRDSGSPRMGAETPLEIAKRRLATGEITHDEYERLREVLNR
jgi:putative membrane protein